jgi:hypothetical protein
MLQSRVVALLPTNLRYLQAELTVAEVHTVHNKFRNSDPGVLWGDGIDISIVQHIDSGRTP